MKHSGIEWIGDIPSNWEIKRFKYLVSEISSGDSLTNEMLSDDDTLYPVFGGGKQIGYYEKSNVTSSNILIGRVGVNCGCITKLTGKAWATDSALIVNSNDITNYLYYLLLTTNLNNLSDANAQPIITASKVLNTKIPFCIDIQEQRSIAAFLDTQCSKIDNIITELEQQIEILKQYKTSLITETVTKGLNKNAPMRNSGIDWIGKIPAHWENKPTKYILESNQETLKESTKADYTFKYNDIGSVDFDKGIINYEEMSFENSPSRARRIVKKGIQLYQQFVHI